MGIWYEAKGGHYILNKSLSAWRIVEDQSKSTTRKFVDSAEEHDVLEALIEQNKPAIKYYDDKQYFKKLHYLLTTPFRYPPLAWGSRFGTKLERGILYASIDLITAMTEKAFYKLAFLQASEGKLGGKTNSYTGFQIVIKSNRFINLCAPPFDAFQKNISSTSSYSFSQGLGKEMRDNLIECFQYPSARHPSENQNSNFNIGVFSPKALLENTALERTFKHFQCYSTKQVIEFSCQEADKNAKYIFPAELFLIDGRIPLPPLS